MSGQLKREVAVAVAVETMLMNQGVLVVLLTAYGKSQIRYRFSQA